MLRTRHAPLSAAIAMAVLAACSGGGDGGVTPPTPTTVTVTCPNGVDKTAATDTAAKALCDMPKVLTILPGDGSTSAPPDGFAGVIVATDSVLDPSTLTSANVMLKVGNLTVIPGVVSATNTKGFAFVPSAKLAYGQQYSFSFSGVKDALGHALDKVGSVFTTSAVSCTAPQVPATDGQSCVAPVVSTCTGSAMANSLGSCISPPQATGFTFNTVIKAWVADVGVLVSGFRALPATCVTIGDQCWEESVANGLIQFANSGVVMTGQNTRPIVFAFYTVNGTFNGQNVLYYLTTPIFADVVGKSTGLNQNVENGGVSGVTGFDVKGSINGLKLRASDGCWEKVYNTGGGFINNPITCPI